MLVSLVKLASVSQVRLNLHASRHPPDSLRFAQQDLLVSTLFPSRPLAVQPKAPRVRPQCSLAASGRVSRHPSCTGARHHSGSWACSHRSQRSVGLMRPRHADALRPACPTMQASDNARASRLCGAKRRNNRERSYMARVPYPKKEDLPKARVADLRAHGARARRRAHLACARERARKCSTASWAWRARCETTLRSSNAIASSVL